jgi:hypothetical protein
LGQLLHPGLSFPWIRCPFCDFCCSCFHRRLHFFCLVLCVRPVRSVRKRRFSLCSSNRGMVQFLYDELSFSSHARTAPCFMVPRSSVVSRCSPAEHSSIPFVRGFNSRLIFNSWLISNPWFVVRCSGACRHLASLSSFDSAVATGVLHFCGCLSLEFGFKQDSELCVSCR